MNPPEGLLLYDFDGVMINSLDEVIITSYNVASAGLATSLAEIPPSYTNLFRINRFHLQPAGDFVLFARYCLEHQEKQAVVLSNAEFDSVLANPSDSLGDRAQQFFESRGKFMEGDKTAWLDLHRPYYPLWTKLLELNPADIVILTNKNRLAVLELCHHFGLLIPPKNIFSADGGVSKITNLQEIRTRFSATHYSFIDDSVRNLSEIKEKVDNSQCPELLLASWGYLGPSDVEQGRAEGFTVLLQEDLVKMI